MRNIKKIYVVLGLGIGITLSGIIGLVSSLIVTDQNPVFNQVEKEDQKAVLNSSDNESGDRTEYKTDKYNQKDIVESEKISEVLNKDVNMEGKVIDDDIESITIVIPKNYGATEIAKLLKENDIVYDSNEFLMLIRENNKETKLQDGTITIPINASNEEILDILTVEN